MFLLLNTSIYQRDWVLQARSRWHWNSGRRLYFMALIFGFARSYVGQPFCWATGSCRWISQAPHITSTSMYSPSCSVLGASLSDSLPIAYLTESCSHVLMFSLFSFLCFCLFSMIILFVLFCQGSCLSPCILLFCLSYYFTRSALQPGVLSSRSLPNYSFFLYCT